MSGPNRTEGALRVALAGAVALALAGGWAVADAPGAYAAAGAAAVFGTLCFAGWPRALSRVWPVRVLLDAVLLGVLVAETGGAGSPLFPLYLLTVYPLACLARDARYPRAESAAGGAALVGGFLVAAVAAGGWRIPEPSGAGLQTGLIVVAGAAALRLGAEMRGAREQATSAENRAALERKRATKNEVVARVAGSSLGALDIGSAMGLVAEAAREIGGGTYAHIAVLRSNLHRTVAAGDLENACPTWWHPSIQRLVLWSCREGDTVRLTETVHGIGGFLAVPFGTREEESWAAIVVGGGPSGVDEERALKRLATTVGPALERPDDARGGLDVATGLPNLASLLSVLEKELSRGKAPAVFAADTGGDAAGDGPLGHLDERLRMGNMRVFRFFEGTLVLLGEDVDGAAAESKARGVLRFLREGSDAPQGSRVAVGYAVAGGEERDSAGALVGAAIGALAKARGEEEGIARGHVRYGVPTSRPAASSRASCARGLYEAMVARDRYLAGHAAGVSRLSRRMGLILSMPEEQLESLAVGALLHDIGKIGISDQILYKPEALTEEEYAVIKRHPSIGVVIAKPFPELAAALPAIAHHHERYDGLGYPDGLRGEDIPLIARVVCAADAFDSMTRERPYGRPVTTEVALDEIRRNAGTQFDPRVARALLRAVLSSGTADPEDDPLTGFAV